MDPISSHMSNFISRKTKGSTLFAVLGLSLAAFLCAVNLQAQTTQFASFSQQDTALRAFTYTNNGTSADFTTNTPVVPVDFRFANVLSAQMPIDLRGVQAAVLNYSSHTTVVAVSDGSGGFNEMFNTVTTITITRTSPASSGNGTRTNLLTVTMTNYTQGFGGNASSINASTPSATITFTSDFLDFSTTTVRAAALAFTGSDVAITQNANLFLNNFSIGGQGNFSSNPIPIVDLPEVNTAGVLSLCVLGAIGVEMMRKRKLKVTATA